jgi:hypothetical protein
MSTDKSAAAIKEFAEKQFPLSKELKKEVLYNQIQQAKQNECFSDLTALISEHYYPKEFVRWKDKKDLRYSSLHNRYYSDTDNGMREFTLDELFNYWEENER